VSAQLHVVFDGNCGFCTRAVGWVRVIDRHGRIELHASQCPDILERFGLTREQVHSAVWAVRDETTGGAHAVAVVLDTALGTRLVERVYRLPLVGWTLEAAYRWVAAHRYMFPGVTPWCEAHPGQCGSPGRA